MNQSKAYNWFVTVADFSEKLAQQAVGRHNNGRAISFNVNDKEQRRKEIFESDIVISMLPANLHFIVAEDCVRLKKI